MSETNRQRVHLDVIDGFRAIAILLVMWFHFWQLSWQGSAFTLFGARLHFDFISSVGFLGVEVFFFISGFCLALPYCRAAENREAPPRIREFFLRRGWKIVPSYFLVIAVLLVLGWTESPMRGFGRVAASLFSHVFFIHNLRPEWVHSIATVLWSVGVEVQFYLLFPFLVGVFLKYPLMTWAGALILANLARISFSFLMPAKISGWMNQLPSVLDLFLTGMLCAYFFVRRPARLSAFYRASSATLLSAVGGLFFLAVLWSGYVRRYENPGFAFWEVHVRTILGAVLFVWVLGSLSAFPFWKCLYANRLFRFFSITSYNLYLWHTVVAQRLFISGVPGYVGSDRHQDRDWMLKYFWVCWVLSIAVGAAVTYGFERPLLRRGHARLLRTLSP